MTMVSIAHLYSRLFLFRILFTSIQTNSNGTAYQMHTWNLSMAEETSLHLRGKISKIIADNVSRSILRTSPFFHCPKREYKKTHTNKSASLFRCSNSFWLLGSLLPVDLIFDTSDWVPILILMIWNRDTRTHAHMHRDEIWERVGGLRAGKSGGIKYIWPQWQKQTTIV